jgi:hypothetical protein
LESIRIALEVGDTEEALAVREWIFGPLEFRGEIGLHG